MCIWNNKVCTDLCWIMLNTGVDPGLALIKPQQLDQQLKDEIHVIHQSIFLSVFLAFTCNYEVICHARCGWWVWLVVVGWEAVLTVLSLHVGFGDLTRTSGYQDSCLGPGNGWHGDISGDLTPVNELTPIRRFLHGAFWTCPPVLASVRYYKKRLISHQLYIIQEMYI